MAKRRGVRRGLVRRRTTRPRHCCPKKALLCPERYTDPLLRQTAVGLNSILALCRERHFQAIGFLLDLRSAMARMSLLDVVYGRPPQDPRRA